jgi:hypothetical protein
MDFAGAAHYFNRHVRQARKTRQSPFILYGRSGVMTDD